jgi:hypothetical protein
MKPNLKVIDAIKNYYFNRMRQYEVNYSNETKSGLKAELNPNFHWDKEGDLNKIFTQMQKQGFVQTQAISGTFWLTYKTRTGKFHTIKTDEDLFPKFELVKEEKEN